MGANAGTAGRMEEATMGRKRLRAEEVPEFLDPGTAVTGELRFSGTLRIDGEFHGSITTDDVLVVGRHADVHAYIRAGEVEIYGSVSGTIEVTRRLEVNSGGTVRGKLDAPVLVLEEGAVLDGQSRMTSPPEGPKPGKSGV